MPTIKTKEYNSLGFRTYFFFFLLGGFFLLGFFSGMDEGTRFFFSRGEGKRHEGCWGWGRGRAGRWEREGTGRGKGGNSQD